MLHCFYINAVLRFLHPSVRLIPCCTLLGLLLYVCRPLPGSNAYYIACFVRERGEAPLSLDDEKRSKEFLQVDSACLSDCDITTFEFP